MGVRTGPVLVVFCRRPRLGEGKQRLARALFIGSDAPSLTVSDLLAAQTALDASDVVLVPARDGGVTLMGSRLPWPDLSSLPWSEPTLARALEECCRDHARSVTRLADS